MGPQLNAIPDTMYQAKEIKRDNEASVIAANGALQELRSNLLSIEYHSTKWRFEWLISPLNVLVVLS